MYTVRHVTDNFPHVVHIGDFVAMGDGSYPRMKRIALYRGGVITSQ